MAQNKIILLTKKNKALEVISYLSDGQAEDLKGACELAGISTKVFDSYLAQFPEIQQEMDKQFRTKLAAVVGQLMDDKSKDVQALTQYREKLRLRVENDLLADKAAMMLMKIGNHLDQTVIQKVLPPVSQPQDAPPQDEEAARTRANAILAGKRGAQLHMVEKRVETYRFAALVEGETAAESTEAIDADVSTVAPSND